MCATSTASALCDRTGERCSTVIPAAKYRPVNRIQTSPPQQYVQTRPWPIALQALAGMMDWDAVLLRVKGYHAIDSLKHINIYDMAFSPTLRLQSLPIFEDSTKVCDFDLSFARDLGRR